MLADATRLAFAETPIVPLYWQKIHWAAKDGITINGGLSEYTLPQDVENDRMISTCSDRFGITAPRTGQAGAPVAPPPGPSPEANWLRARGVQLDWFSQSVRACPAGAVTRLPRAGRRGPICRGPNRSVQRNSIALLGALELDHPVPA